MMSIFVVELVLFGTVFDFIVNAIAHRDCASSGPGAGAAVDDPGYV